MFSSFYFPLGIEIILAIMVISIVFVIISENRRPYKTLSWILVLIFLPVIGILLYLFLGRSNHKESFIVKKLYKGLDLSLLTKPDLSSSDTYPREYKKLISMLFNLNKTPVLTGNKIEFFTSGKDKFKSLFADIENAVNHIHLLYYKIEDDETGNSLKKLLIQKARQGIEVRVIYDDVGSIKTKKRFFAEMEKEGIEVECFLEVRIPQIAQHINYRNHRKIAVIDGKIGYTGGMNVGDSYVNGYSWGKWKDVQIRVEGNGVKGMQVVFFADWYLSRKSVPKTGVYFPPMADDKETPLQIVSSGPIDKYHSIEKGILQAINTAEKSIYMQTPYFMPSEAILTALQLASASGIEVHVMLSKKSDSFLVDRTTHSYVNDLLKYNINTYLYDGGFLHSKIMIIDDTFLSIGSANMDTRSFELSFETNAFIYDAKTARQAKNIFLEDIKESILVDEKEWKKRSLWRKFMESVMRLFTPVF